MTRSIQVLVTCIITTLAIGEAPVFAAPSEDADATARTGTKGGATVYDFDDDNVEGEVLSPDGALITGRVRGKHASMITIKPHFISELIKLSNDL